jgi:glycosyltransferase involved in cell wall biosynthesis
MICNKADSDLYEEVNKNLPQNCRLLEHVSADEIELCFNNCKLFINTSEFEGFPNTFLQAAKYGKPIISYKVNPNNFITENNCGTFCNGKTEEVISALTELLNDDKVYALKSQNALLSVKKHDIEKVGKSLMEFF